MGILGSLLIFFLVSNVFAGSGSSLVISRVTRDIYLKGKYVRVSYDITMQNDGSNEVKEYLHLIKPEYAHSLIDILIFDKDYSKLVHIKEDKNSVLVKLPSVLRSGDKVTIKVLELYKNRMIPKPPVMTLEFVFIPYL